MKKLVIALFVLSMVRPVLAEKPPAEPRPIVEASHNAVVAFLKLTPEQVEDWGAIYRVHREAEQPLQEDIKVVQGKIDELFEAGSPDPAAVGELFIQRRDLGERLLEVHIVYHEDFLLILDDTQTRKLRFIARADDVQKFIPAFKLFELIPRR